jgi:hypothetical protein
LNKRDTYSLLRVEDLTINGTVKDSWHVLYTDFDGTEKTVVTDLKLRVAKKLVAEGNRTDRLPDAMMKYLSF